MKQTILCMLIMGLVTVPIVLPIHAIKKIAMTRFVLKGQSTGGVLVLTRVPQAMGVHPHFVVTNSPGDDADIVLERLARAITASGYVPGSVETVKKGDGLVLPSGLPLWRDGKEIETPYWIVGGTDRGFNVPPAPAFLSATCDSNKVVLRWVNEAAYDSVWVFGGPSGAMAIEVLPGNADRFACDLTRLMFGAPVETHGPNIVIAVVGVKDGVPSTATAIRLVNFVRQEPVINVPFSHGVVPGFRSWAHTTTGSKVECEQGVLYPRPLGGGTEHYRLKFYQVFKGNGRFQAGLYRRWLGLRSGHTYRLSALLDKVDAKTSGLSLTLHATQLSGNGKDLAPKQMAGEEALPDGRIGKTAGLLARYDATSGANAQQMETPSGIRPLETVAGEITLSGDSDSIAVWFRLEGKDAQEVAVAFDLLTIEDLGKR